jgi:outer membrane protein
VNAKAAVTLLLMTISILLFGQAPGAGSRANGTERGEGGTARMLSLDEAVRGAVANRPLINRALASVQAARARVGEARDAYIPSVDGLASWQHAAPKQQQAAGTEVADLSPSDYWEFGIGASVSLYDFGRRSFRIKMAQEGVAAAELGLAQIRSSLAYQAAQAFFDLVFTKEEIVSLDGQKRDLEAHLAIVRARVESGSATKYDALTTKVRITSLEGQRAEALHRQARGRLMLAGFIGEPFAANIDVSGSLDRSSANSCAYGADSIDRALAARTEVALARNASALAELDARAVELDRLPSLSASARTGFKNPIVTLDNTSLDKPIFNWSVGLSASVPLDGAVLARNRRAEARSRLDAARQDEAAVKEEVSLRVAGAYADYEASLAALENAREQSSESAQALEAARTRFELGSIANDAYLDSQLSFEEAQLSVLAALHRRVSCEYALRQELGEKIWDARE